MNQYVYVRLNGLYNHKVFMSRENYREEYQNTADYCVAVNRFFDPAISQNSDGSNAKGIVSFDMGFVGAEGYDNISCNGQIIAIHPGTYNKVSFLGFCEYGNCIDTVIVQYRGSDVNLEIGMLDFGSYKKDDDLGFSIKYGCVQEFYTKATKVNDPGNEVSAYIFSSTYAIDNSKEITSIVLPVNELIHISAITLIKAE